MFSSDFAVITFLISGNIVCVCARACTCVCARVCAHVCVCVCVCVYVCAVFPRHAAGVTRWSEHCRPCGHQDSQREVDTAV